jgi:hypothetical protein
MTITPVASYKVYSLSNLTTTGVSNLQIILQPIINTVKFAVLTNGVLYVGQLAVTITDNTGVTVYSGNLSSLITTWPAPLFPLSIVVTSTIYYQVYTQTNI